MSGSLDNIPPESFLFWQEPPLSSMDTGLQEYRQRAAIPRPGYRVLYHRRRQRSQPIALSFVPKYLRTRDSFTTATECPPYESCSVMSRPVLSGIFINLK